MSRTAPRWCRWGSVFALLALAGLFWFEAANAQPGVPPRGGGQFGGRPGGIGGGAGGAGGMAGGGFRGAGGGAGGMAGSGPIIVKTWTCSKCGKVMGNGDFPPATCPNCGARIVNGGGPPGPVPPPQFDIPPISSTSTSTASTSVLVGIFIGIGVLVLFAAAVAGGIFLIMRSASSGPAKRSISRRAPRDDYEDRPRRRRRPD